MKQIREKNIVRKRRYAFRIALLYPSTYQASLSSLGLQTLYYYLNSYKEIYAERVIDFGQDVPKSIETGSSLKKFDIILATTTYELDYPTIAFILSKSGINPLRKERTEEDPTIVIGGPSPTAAPEPLFDIADAVFRGEGEALVPSLINSLYDSNSKKELIDVLASVRGMWIPETNETSEIAIINDLDKAFHPIAQIQSENTEPIWGRALLVEPSRGCNRGCSFCMEASITKPRRERRMETLEKIIDEGVFVNEVNKVAFYTLSFFDSRQGKKLLELIMDKKLNASIPSIRADVLDEEKIILMRKVGQKTVTIAPETPVFQLQKIISKFIPEEKILEVARIVSLQKMNIKLYYMFGLPGETIEDLEKIILQVKKVSDILKNRSKIRISINPFIPKPHTLLWREEMEDLKSLKKKTKYLKEKLSSLGRVEVYPAKIAWMQYEINRMGKKSTSLLLNLMKKKIRLALSYRVKEELKGGLEAYG